MSDDTCFIGICERPVRAMGWCEKHYVTHRYLGQECSVDGCSTMPRALGMCNRHYRGQKPPCEIEGCNSPIVSRGYCMSHSREFSDYKRECPECGEAFEGHERRKYCSLWCKAQAKRSPVRKAVEAGDYAAVIVAARQCSSVSDTGCWEWQYAKTPAGYGVIGQGGSGGLVHRHVMQASLGRPVGKMTVHHKCANRGCVNPEHLELASQRENTAEMLLRNFYVTRITELEDALMTIDPAHPLLTSITETGSAS